MSNIKNAPTLTVAFGDVIPEVLNFMAKDYAMDIELENGETDVSTVNDERSYVYYVPYNKDYAVPKYTLFNALASLHDHINNVPESELTENMICDDYMCCNPDHIENQVSCQASLDSCIIVRVYQFTYYAQGCVVDAYYVKEVE